MERCHRRSETITIRRNPATGQFVAGEYRYRIHNYSGTPELNVSSARVVVNQNVSQVVDLHVADAAGNPARDIWFVVKLTLDANGSLTTTSVQELHVGDESTVF